MSHVIYKNLNSTPITAMGGEGVWLIDRAGKRYLDTCGGVAVSSLGHCHPRIVAAIEREAKKLSWAHAGSFTTPAAEELAQLLTQSSNGLTKVQFLSGGSEVMELSLKVACQYHFENGTPSKNLFLARRQNYHGSSLATLAISGNRQRRSIFEPILMPAAFVSPCYAYRDQHIGETEEEYADRLADELEAKILEVGAENIAGFIAETVVGSTSGAVPPVAGYFSKIKNICERYDILLILDEIMAGMGRTGWHYAYLEDDIMPDIVVIGKGLAAGYQPISAMLVSPRIHSVIAQGSGVLRNGQTHVNHPLACAVALEVQRTIMEEDLMSNVLKRGEQLQALLRERLMEQEWIGDIRGRGLFVGVEFVVDRQSKSPHTGGDALAAALKKESFERGLLIYPGSGTVDGTVGNHVLFAPPFIATELEIEEMVERFSKVVLSCLPRFQHVKNHAYATT